MNQLSLIRFLLLLAFSLGLWGCKSGPKEKRAIDGERSLQIDTLTLQNRFQPMSILVLPPVNESADANASDAFLSTITKPLAERGYYIYPIAVVDQMMKENGLPTPGDMHQAPRHKLREVFGADAVLYVVLREWRTRYYGVNTSNKVKIEYLLVDLNTGTPLWHKTQTAVNNSSGIPTSVTGVIISAAQAGAAAVKSAMVDEERKLAIEANRRAIHHKNHGLIRGPRAAPAR